MHKYVLALAIAVFAFGCSSEKPAADPANADANVAPAGDKAANAASGDEFETKLRPMLVANCSPCHVGSDAKKGVNVEFVSRDDKRALQEMHHEIEEGKMPPKNSKPLDEATKTELLAALASAAK